MALDKKENIEHDLQDGCQSGNVIWTPFIKCPPSWFFQNIQSILNSIILSLYICKTICDLHLFSLILQSIILICLKKCHPGLENKRFKT